MTGSCGQVPGVSSGVLPGWAAGGQRAPQGPAQHLAMQQHRAGQSSAGWTHPAGSCLAGDVTRVTGDQNGSRSGLVGMLGWGSACRGQVPLSGLWALCPQCSPAALHQLPSFPGGTLCLCESERVSEQELLLAHSSRDEPGAPSGSPTWVQGPNFLGHHSQVHYQGAGWAVERLGLEPAAIRNAGPHPVICGVWTVFPPSMQPILGDRPLGDPGVMVPRALGPSCGSDRHQSDNSRWHSQQVHRVSDGQLQGQGLLFPQAWWGQTCSRDRYARKRWHAVDSRAAAGSDAGLVEALGPQEQGHPSAGEERPRPPWAPDTWTPLHGLARACSAPHGLLAGVGDCRWLLGKAAAPGRRGGAAGLTRAPSASRRRKG